jgi:asparagine synthetase B (glutamine-hydrolysing)
MCGISGILLNRPLEGTDLERGRRATVMLEHRGPEGSGEWMDRARGVYPGMETLPPATHLAVAGVVSGRLQPGLASDA